VDGGDCDLMVIVIAIVMLLVMSTSDVGDSGVDCAAQSGSVRIYDIFQPTVQLLALQQAIEQQHGIPPHKISKFLVCGENLTVRVLLFLLISGHLQPSSHPVLEHEE